MDDVFSRDICIECGIEPVHKCSYTGFACPHNCPKEVIKEYCNDKSEKTMYIDFHNNNNNFVKLLEILNSKNFLISSYECKPHQKLKPFILDKIRRLLKSNSDCVEELKQVIREQLDWEY